MTVILPILKFLDRDVYILKVYVFFSFFSVPNIIFSKALPLWVISSCKSEKKSLCDFFFFFFEKAFYLINIIYKIYCTLIIANPF